MAQIILHLLVLKLDKKDLRYIILGTSEGLPSPTPLFLGADVLEGSGIPTANHCRIHARYAKKGLATKLTFPSEVSLSGVTNIHNGAWFYNVQGVLQVVFEYHEPKIQVDIVSRLVELWKRNHNDPALPDSIQVEKYQLPKQLTGEYSFDCLLQLLTSHGDRTSLAADGDFQAEQFLADQETTVEVNGTQHLFSIQSEGYVLPDLCTSEAQHATERAHCSEEDMHPKRPESFEHLLDKMASQAQCIKQGCDESEVSYANALTAFLRILKGDLQRNKTSLSNECSFESFLDILLDYDFIIGDPVKLKSFCSPWGVSEKYNALLCLVSEWLGKKLFQFNEAITNRIEEFKSQNIDHIQDLPPPQVLVQELFPHCMQLLVGHWIGLYDTKNETSVSLSEGKPTDGDETTPSFTQGSRKQKSGNNSQSREDHSYSTPLELGTHASSGKDESSSGAPPMKKARLNPNPASVLNATGATATTDPAGISSYEDHNYYSTSPQQTSAVENNPLTPRDDHTYVANPASDAEDCSPGPNSSENTRKDHTYVATNHNKKGKNSVGSLATNIKEENDTVSEPMSSKRSSPAHISQGGKELTKHVVDSSKYPFIQIILEFINNALISGVAHVVYTRLLLS